MGNCASWCAGDEDEGLASSVRHGNQQMSPHYGYKQPPLGRSQPPADTEEMKKKVREAAEKRYSEDKAHKGASGALRYQQERKQKIDEAEDRVARAGGVGQPALRWQQD